MFDFYDFFFCPIHGLFRPANLALILPMLSGLGIATRMYWSRIIELFKVTR